MTLPGVSEWSSMFQLLTLLTFVFGVEIAATRLAERILNNFKIPYYRMGPRRGVTGRGAKESLVALIDNPKDIPKELRPYVTSTRKSEVILEGKAIGSPPELDIKRVKRTRQIRTDQLEHDTPKKRTTKK